MKAKGLNLYTLPLWMNSCIVSLWVCLCVHAHLCLWGQLMFSRGAVEPHTFMLCVWKVLLTAGKLREAFPVLLLKRESNENWQKDNCHTPEVSHCSVKWRWSQKQQQKEVTINHRRLYHPSCLVGLVADVWQTEGTKCRLCLFPALNSYLSYLDDVLWEDETHKLLLWVLGKVVKINWKREGEK